MKFIKISLLVLAVTFPTIESAQAYELGEVADRVVGGAVDCVAIGAITGTVGAVAGYGVKLATNSEKLGLAVAVGSAAAGCAAGAYVGSTPRETYPSDSDLATKDETPSASDSQ
ncbi:MAG: hypothetical protein ACXWQO_06550 [Bdellovibrionota bacterium]